MGGNISQKINKSITWSSITELSAKLVTPITNMVLARMLSPEVFGVVATITMLISFVDMFTDAGFQKYIVQQEFNDEREKELSTNVAFWTNLIISIVLWGLIVIFSEEIAILVGNPGLGNVISVSCIQLPLTSFSSIQMAVYRRSFDFKTLFMVRIVGICIPFFVTIPLAFLNFGYWSLILGNICAVLSNAIILTIKSSWKPKIEYKIEVLKQMISFSIWSLIESISIWLSTWIDTFIIGTVLNTYYLGLYKSSISTVVAIFDIITKATTPVLFSALSRVQNNEDDFRNIYFSMQKSVGYLVLPMSIGIFVYSDVVVRVLLGSQWLEASPIVGIWGLAQGIVIVLAHYASEVYRSKGKPKLSFFAQLLFLLILVPVCFIYSKYDFMTFINARAGVRFVFIAIQLIIMKKFIGIPINQIMKNIRIPLQSSMAMGVIGYILKGLSGNFLWQFMSIFICIVVYFVILMSFRSSREDILNIMRKTGISKKLKIKYLQLSR